MKKPARSGTPEPQTFPWQTERRRSPRSSMVERVAVSWHTLDGIVVTEETKTEVVSAHGALLQMRHAPPVVRQVIKVTRTQSNDWSLARVMDSASEKPDGLILVAVEFVVPSNLFWRGGFKELTELSENIV